MVSRYGAKKDANHGEIVDFLVRTATPHFDTSPLGCGFPDLIVCVRGVVELWEIKNPKNSYGRKGLNKNQQAFVTGWPGGPVVIIRSVDEALARLNGKSGGGVLVAGPGLTGGLA